MTDTPRSKSPAIVAKTPRTADAETGAARAEAPPETGPQTKGRAAMRPEINGLLVIGAFKQNIMGKDVDMGTMLDSLESSVTAVAAGDMASMEAMLVSQAAALQTLFTSLAIQAARQDHLGRFQDLLNLALKAQGQCRATISALVDLKYPRQATFVKQANIAQGAQQVNNQPVVQGRRSRVKNMQPAQNKLLEASNAQEQVRLDTRAAQAAGRPDPEMATLEPVHRPQERGGQGGRGRKRI